MSSLTVTRVKLVCDGCGEITNEDVKNTGLDIRRLRAHMSLEKWTSETVGTGVMDYCPKPGCQEQNDDAS